MPDPESVCQTFEECIKLVTSENTCPLYLSDHLDEEPNLKPSRNYPEFQDEDEVNADDPKFIRALLRTIEARRRERHEHSKFSNIVQQVLKAIKPVTTIETGHYTDGDNVKWPVVQIQKSTYQARVQQRTLDQNNEELLRRISNVSHPSKFSRKMSGQNLPPPDSEDPSTLEVIRRHLLQYQQQNDIAPSDTSFLSLITSLATQALRAVFAMMIMILSVLPILQVFLYVFNFILDSLIEIKNSPNRREMVMKGLIFFVQMVAVIFCVIFLLGSIIVPIWRMIAVVFRKFFFFI